VNTPQLIVLGGLPGTGKSTIARALLARLPAAYLRIDTLEQALAALHPGEEVGAAGYLLAYELARSNLALGMPVLADCVNPVAAPYSARGGCAILGSLPGSANRLLGPGGTPQARGAAPA
jgi:chloramphenicol 3-O-phosphotransferase